MPGRLGQERRLRLVGEHAMHQQVVCHQRVDIDRIGVAAIPPRHPHTGQHQRVDRAPPGPPEGAGDHRGRTADHLRRLLEPVEQFVQQQGLQRCPQTPGQLQRTERGPDETGPVAERDHPATALVHQVLQVEQLSPAGGEPGEQLVRALLALVGVPEEHVPVRQRRGIVGQLLDADDHHAGIGARPRAGGHQFGARPDVLGVGEHPHRRRLHQHPDARRSQFGGRPRRDRRAPLAVTLLGAQQDRRAAHASIRSASSA